MRARAAAGAAAPLGSLDLLVNRGAVAVRAELLQFESFGCVATVLLGGVAGHTWRTLGGVGPAFGALESDNDPDALVFGHGRTLRRVSEAKWNLTPYLLTGPRPELILQVTPLSRIMICQKAVG